MTKTRTTKQLSEALAQIQAEAITRIGFLFKNKLIERITFGPEQSLKVDYNRKRCIINEINRKGRVQFTFTNAFGLNSGCMVSDLSTDALLTILDEIERMKKAGQLKK